MAMIGFAPDIDQTTQGALRSVTNCLPTINGIRGAPTPVDTIWILDGASRGCVTIETLSNGTKKYLGQGNYLFELNGAGLSLVGTGLLSGTGRAMFTTFGNAVIACNGADGGGLVSSTGGWFTSISGSPSAKIIEGVGLFVMAFDYHKGTDTYHDGWYSSALGDYTDWTPAAATWCENGRFLDTPGGVTAARRLGDGIIAYKKRAMYYGQFVGSGSIGWQWSQVATNIGCVGQDAVVNAGGVHYFVGAEDIFVHDGSRPRSIGAGIKRWFFSDVAPSYLDRVMAVHDRNDDHVYFWYCSNAHATGTYAGWYDTAIVYNMLTGQWGRVTGLYQDIMTYQSGTDTLSVVGLSSSNYRVQDLSGACNTASMTTWDIGDDDRYSRLQKVRPRYLTSPTSATATHYHRNAVGVALTTGSTDTMVDHKLNFGASDRWHRIKIDTVGDFELSQINITESVTNGNK